MSHDAGIVHPKRLVVAVFLILVGIVIGVTLVSEFHSVPNGDAVGESKKLKPSGAPPGVASGEQPFVEISSRVTPAVVNISSTRVIRQRDDFRSSPFDDPFFRKFFGDDFFFHRNVPKQRREQSLGSGVIVEADGVIITNNHVVAKADEITVVLSDKREFKGKVIGSDPKSDLAVVRIKADDLPTVEWADSDRLQVGEYVLAIGNPFGLNQTVTMGIVSAIGRANVGVADYEDFIQTDAAINPGNSGGALVNTQGELVGINTAIFSQSGGYMGIGFAVPSNMAKSVMESLLKDGKVVRGWLGVSIQEVTAQLAKEFGLKEAKGALVTDVLDNSPAQKAGLQQGDVVVAFMGEPINNPSQLRNQIAQVPVGRRVSLSVVRNGARKEFQMKIGEQPKEMASSDAQEEGGQEEGKTDALAGVYVRTLTPALAREMEIDKSQKGVVVVNVEEGSAAQEAGLVQGDLIMEINRQPVRDIEGYKALLSNIDSQDGILLLISRQGRAIFLSVTPDNE